MTWSLPEILKLDDSCISNPKSKISNSTYFDSTAVQFKILDFGFETQESSNFKIVFAVSLGRDIWRFVIRGFSGSHHLREDDLSSLCADLREMRSEHNSTDNAYSTTERNSRRSSHEISQYA